ncbi:HNH homing endonuclease [Acinetobacter phage nACB1]|nr:HNH homing endonuclease [Acinetobacter phage nACB1]
MKTCKLCNQTKDITNFSKGKATCKPCSSVVTQERNKTPNGVVNMMYSNQRMTSRNMGRPAPDYTLAELREWVLSQPNWNTLYSAWVNSGYDKYIKPSCDRINSAIPYKLSNLQLVTFQENLNNKVTDNLKGLHLGANGSPVRQLTLNGVLVTEHASVLIAMRSLGKNPESSSNIHQVCKGKLKTAYGFKWEYI